jgi:hypothetical protein
VYWYGSSSSNAPYGYQPQATFVAWDDKLPAHWDKYKAVADKLAAGKKLTKKDMDMLAVKKEVDEDLSKHPNERIRPKANFPEGYDLLSLDDLNTLSDQDIEDYAFSASDGEEETVDELVMSPPAESDTKTKKRKQSKNANAQPKKTKLTKLNSKSSGMVTHEKAANVEDMNDFGDADVDDDEVDAMNIKHALEDDSGPSSDDASAFGSDVDVDVPDDNLVVDEPESSKKKKSKPAGDKVLSTSTAKKVGGSGRTFISLSKKAIEKEISELRRCETKYADVVRSCLQAVDSEQFLSLGKSFDEMSLIVNDCSAPFIELYLVPATKRAKAFLKSKVSPSAINTLEKVRAVWKNLASVYERKIVSVPADFKLPPAKSLSDTNSGYSAKGTVSIREISEVNVAVGIKKSRLTQQQVERVGNVPRDEELLQNLGKDFEASTQKNKGGFKGDAKDDFKAAVKDERKVPPRAFSLGKLMQRDPSTQILRAASGLMSPPILSSWWAEPFTGEEVTDAERVLAVYFFEDMFAHFPPGKISVEHASRALEKAVFEYAAKGDEGVERDLGVCLPEYQARIHGLVAAIVGVRGSGTLMNLIMNGDYPTPQKLAAVSDEDLMNSFKGKPFL